MAVLDCEDITVEIQR